MLVDLSWDFPQFVFAYYIKMTCVTTSPTEKRVSGLKIVCRSFSMGINIDYGVINNKRQYVEIVGVFFDYYVRTLQM